MGDTINGAKTSAIIYSIVETAKANNLKPYDYIPYILEEIPKHMDDTDCSFLENLLPWSPKLPAEIKKVNPVDVNSSHLKKLKYSLLGDYEINEMKLFLKRNY